MKKLYGLAAALLMSGAALAQVVAVAPQNPCSTFENPNPAGNWTTAFCTAQYVNTNPLDGSQCVTLWDGSGGSWYSNTVDYNNLGKLHNNQCLCFDYALINDGGSGVPFYPTIYLSDGVNTIAFVSATAVTPGSGWIHVCAPIQHCAGSGPLPSNTDGSWQLVTGSTCADFNSVLDGVTSVAFPTDINSCPCEEMMIDNVCVTNCSNCQSDFSLDVNYKSDGTAIGNIFLNTTDPSATYKVDWGDGSGLTTPYISKIYSAPGTYNVCVYEYIQNVLVCQTCMTFCYSEHTTRTGGGGVIGQPNNPDSRVIAKSSTLVIRSLGDKKFADEGFTLFPNPTKDYAEVQMNLADRAQVSIKVIDMYGKVVSESSSSVDRGSQKVKVNTEKLPTGIYNVEINVGGQSSTQKLSVTK